LAIAYVLGVVILLAVGAHVTAPEESTALTPAGGGLGAASHALFGRPGGTDFLPDYVSALALRRNWDAYDITDTLSKRIHAEWPVENANPHPPTLLPLVLPFTLLSYQHGLAAWALAMICVYIATVRLMKVPWTWAIGVGLALAAAFPGAYGITNPVPLIGLGIAIAYRYRYDPLVAGIGLALATAPKVSGVLVFVPFLVARRFKTVAIGVGILAALAAIPMLFQSNVWSRYFSAGVHGADVNAARGDNASLLNFAERWHLSHPVAIVIIGVIAVLAALRTRDTFWPVVWVVVAALPIAWMYSLLTLLPLAVWIVLKRNHYAGAIVLVATGLMIGGSPLGQWPVAVVPIVVALALIALVLTAVPDDERFWIPEAWEHFVPGLRSRQRSDDLVSTGGPSSLH
jgi:hypothetical protein